LSSSQQFLGQSGARGSLHGHTVAVSYGMLSANLHGVYDIGQCMCSGSRWLMPLLLLYVLFAEFYGSALYVLG
jgi:hypothetical protein